MKLKKLAVNGFRNLTQTEMTFSERLNIFFGNNGQGKTNLLEAIYLLGTMKSFRNARNTELIQWQKPHGVLHGWVEKDGAARQISLLLEQGGKKVRLDRKPVAKLADFFGSLNVVVFSPEEMAMAKGLPEVRRRYLDRAIFSGDASYLALHQEYHLILRNRNVLLKNGEMDHLDLWSEKLAETGGRLMARRLDYVASLEPLLKRFLRQIAGKDEEAGFGYSGGAESGSTAADCAGILMQEMRARKNEEGRRGLTLAGPHRHDLELTLNGRPLKRYGSQGQQRSYVLALKMAEIEYLQNIFGTPPILLLDDMTSELDAERKQNLMDFLSDRLMQVFITTTSLDNIALDGKNEYSGYHSYRVTAGEVKTEH